jgi:WD40 repeat protein
MAVECRPSTFAFIAWFGKDGGMNQKSYSQILDQVAHDQMAANTNLAPRILARIQKGKNRNMQPRMKVFVAVLVVLLVIMIGLVSVPGVRAAIQRWIGYVPGIGLVSDGQIRMLAEPVSVTRDGITLTVEEMWTTTDETLIQVSVEGWPWRKLVIDSPANGCLNTALLRLSDRELTNTQPQSAVGWETGYELKSIYPTIPPTVNDVIFVMPCLILAMPGEAPENWELPLRLIPAPADTVFPVIEISTPVAVTSTVAPQIQTNPTLSTDGVSLVLDRAVQMDDGYLIYATLHYENSGLGSIDIPLDPATLHLLDASGQEVAYELDWEAMNEIQATFVPGQTAFAIKTAPIQMPGPLTLVLDSLSASLTTDASFTFDPGPDLKPGEAWDLGLDLDVGNGHSLRVTRVSYDLTDGVQAYLRFDMESKTGVMYATLLDKEHPLTGIAGGGGGSFSIGPFTSDLYYNEPLPKGPLTVTVTSISAQLPGHWEAAWTPPQTQTLSTPQLSACLTRESWRQAVQAQPSLPAGLSGTLALSGPLPPDYYYQMSIAKLTDSAPKSIGFGSVPSLSPDGTRVVHMGPVVNSPADGLYITDLASGNTTLLPGTTRGDMNPLWSPDGQTIAFTRGPSSGLIGAPGPYNILLTNADGTNTRQLTEGIEANHAMAWMPDGDGLLYTTISRDGASLHIMNVQTGEVASLFDINYSGTVAVSPDGKRLAFEEMLPLDKYGLFVSDLNGSNRKSLADGNPYVVTVPTWSPDGNWVIASVHDPNASNQPATFALIGVDSCQIISVPNLRGYVTSWLP